MKSFPKPKRRKCPDCGRIVTLRADRFIEHPVYPMGIQYCSGGGLLSLREESGKKS